MSSIMQYVVGSAVIAMAGKNCVAIAADRRYGIRNQTGVRDAEDVQDERPDAVGLTGLATDVQTLAQKFNFRSTCTGPRGRAGARRPRSNMVSSLLYEKRFGPYFCEPVIAGLGEGDKPYLCGMDLLGAQVFTDNFILAGDCTEAMYGLCESMYKPDLEPDDLFETLAQCLLSGVDRDCLAGWGCVVHVITPEGTSTPPDRGAGVARRAAGRSARRASNARSLVAAPRPLAERASQGVDPAPFASLGGGRGGLRERRGAGAGRAAAASALRPALGLAARRGDRVARTASARATPDHHDAPRAHVRSATRPSRQEIGMSQGHRGAGCISVASTSRSTPQPQRARAVPLTRSEVRGAARAWCGFATTLVGVMKVKIKPDGFAEASVIVHARRDDGARANAFIADAPRVVGEELPAVVGCALWFWAAPSSCSARRRARGAPSTTSSATSQAPAFRQCCHCSRRRSR